MLRMTLTHLEAAILFAGLISAVLGAVTQDTTRDRLRYGLRCFGYFLLALFGLGWLMYFGHG